MFDDKSFDNLPGHWSLARLGKRVLGMRRVFRKHRDAMFAVGFICRRRAEALA